MNLIMIQRLNCRNVDVSNCRNSKAEKICLRVEESTLRHPKRVYIRASPGNMSDEVCPGGKCPALEHLSRYVEGKCPPVSL